MPAKDLGACSAYSLTSSGFRVRKRVEDHIGRHKCYLPSNRQPTPPLIRIMIRRSHGPAVDDIFCARNRSSARERGRQQVGYLARLRGRPSGMPPSEASALLAIA